MANPFPAPRRKPTKIERNYDIDFDKIDREMDLIKYKIFSQTNAAFLGSILCSLNFAWTSDQKTACTDGLILWWNPYFWATLDEESRIFILLHELWHVAFLHMLRRGDRDPELWNYACDYAINAQLYADGYKCPKSTPLFDSQFNGMNAEAIYDIINSPTFSMGGVTIWGVDGDYRDLLEPGDVGSDGSITTTHAGLPVVGSVVQAAHAAELAGEPLPQSERDQIETILKRFLQPKLPWNVLLMQFFTDLDESDYTWARPNRRYQDIYLPSIDEGENRFEHLMYFLDVSGSVSDGQVLRFNSEVKHIKETFNPRMLTLVLFDDIIQKVYEFTEDDPFEEVIIVGRGGTSLVPVRQMIIDKAPTAAIVFSDLQCPAMEPLPAVPHVPIIWVAIANKGAKVNMGKLIHITD